MYEEGVKHVGRLLVLYLYPGDDLARAVVASRKVGGAVTRNRAKRLLREAIRSRVENQPETAAAIRREYWPPAESIEGPDASSGRGLWIVTVARRNIVGRGYQDVLRELDQLLDRPSAPSPAEPPTGPGN